MKTVQISLIHIHTDEEASVSSFYDLLSKDSIVQNSWFGDVTIDNQIIEGQFYNQKIVSNLVYDSSTNNIKKVENVVVSTNQFEVDFANQLMLYYGPSKTFPSFKRCIQKQTKSFYKLSSIDIDVLKLWDELYSKFDTGLIVSAEVDNYKLNDKVYGYFKPFFNSNNTAYDLLAPIKHKIIRLKTSFVLEEEIIFTFSNVCRFAIKGNRGDITKLLKTIKKIVTSA